MSSCNFAVSSCAGVREWWMAKDLAGSSRGYIEVKSCHLLGGTEKTTKNLRRAGIPTENRTESGVSPLRQTSMYISPFLSDNIACFAGHSSIPVNSSPMTLVLVLLLFLTRTQVFLHKFKHTSRSKRSTIPALPSTSSPTFQYNIAFFLSLLWSPSSCSIVSKI
jgi:hypothetical protein